MRPMNSTKKCSGTHEWYQKEAKNSNKLKKISTSQIQPKSNITDTTIFI